MVDKLRYDVHETPVAFELRDGIRYEPPRAILTVMKDANQEDTRLALSFLAAYIEGHYKTNDELRELLKESCRLLLTHDNFGAFLTKAIHALGYSSFDHFKRKVVLKA